MEDVEYLAKDPESLTENVSMSFFCAVFIHEIVDKNRHVARNMQGGADMGRGEFPTTLCYLTKM